ncbi:hypothetical protein [Bradyrhizobium liaoningense]
MKKEDGLKFDPVKELAVHAGIRTGIFPAPNSSVFRYVSLRDERAWRLLECTILESKISLTTPVSFNDPFDSNPVIVSDVSFREMARALNDLPINGVPLGDKKIFDSSGREVTDSELEKRTLRSIADTFVRDNAPKMASFCRRISSQLLWSHYANSYRGLAYHFAYSGRPESGLRHIRPVEYSRQRPIILASEMLDVIQATGQSSALYQLNMSFERKAFLTKSIEWSYEEEERLLYRADVVDFEPSELAAIIIGPHFSDEHLAKLRSIVEKRPRPLRTYRAKLAESDYAIEVDWANRL